MRDLGLPLAFVVLFALMPIMIFFSDPDAMLSFRKTETAAGRVERVDKSHGCDGSSVQITYSFSTPEGITYRDQETVCAGTPYAKLREGDSIPIVYVVGKPEVHGIAGGNRMNARDFPFPVLLFPVFALFFFVPLFWPRYSQLLGDRRLFRNGPLLAKGKVVFVKKEQGSSWPGLSSPTRATVYIEVRSPTGTTREVRATCTNDWLVSHLPPGAEVTVVCHATNPRAVLAENYLR